MTTPAPNPAPTDPNPAPAPTDPNPAPWHGMADPEVGAYVQNKGWQSPADVIRSYQGAEKLIGRDPSTLLVMPRADDPEGQRALYTKLGMPESPDKYELDQPKDLAVDDGYMAWARDAFHKIGLTAAQAKALTTQHNEFLRARFEQQAKDYELNADADAKTLQREWGGGYERQMTLAKSAANSLGFTGEMIDAMEQAVGYGGVMRFFAELGQKLGEDNFVSQDTRAAHFSNMLTPAEAKVQWDQAKLDPNFTKALTDRSHPGHAAAKEKQAKLFAVMFPEG